MGVVASVRPELEAKDEESPSDRMTEDVVAVAVAFDMSLEVVVIARALVGNEEAVLRVATGAKGPGQLTVISTHLAAYVCMGGQRTGSVCSSEPFAWAVRMWTGSYVRDGVAVG